MGIIEKIGRIILLGTSILTILYFQENRKHFGLSIKEEFREGSKEELKLNVLRANLFEFIEEHTSAEVSKKYEIEFKKLRFNSADNMTSAALKDLGVEYFGDLSLENREIFSKMIREMHAVIRVCNGDKIAKNYEELRELQLKNNLIHYAKAHNEFINNLKELRTNQFIDGVNSIDDNLISQDQKKKLIENWMLIRDSEVCLFEEEEDDNFDKKVKIIKEKAKIYRQMIKIYEEIFKSEVKVLEFNHHEEL